jgi:hypothetical protein
MPRNKKINSISLASYLLEGPSRPVAYVIYNRNEDYSSLGMLSSDEMEFIKAFASPQTLRRMRDTDSVHFKKAVEVFRYNDRIAGINPVGYDDRNDDYYRIPGKGLMAIKRLTGIDLHHLPPDGWISISSNKRTYFALVKKEILKDIVLCWPKTPGTPLKKGCSHLVYSFCLKHPEATYADPDRKFYAPESRDPGYEYVTLESKFKTGYQSGLYYAAMPRPIVPGSNGRLADYRRAIFTIDDDPMEAYQTACGIPGWLSEEEKQELYLDLMI